MFGGSCPLTEFCQVQNSLCVSSLGRVRRQRYCTAIEQRASAKICGVLQGIELRTFADGATYNRLGGHHVFIYITFWKHAYTADYRQILALREQRDGANDAESRKGVQASVNGDVVSNAFCSKHL